MTAISHPAERDINEDSVREVIETVSSSFHSHGSLHADVLWKIAEEHKRAGARTSTETGCGLSTLLLSHLSESHTVFTTSDGDSLLNTQNSPYLRSSTTRFVVGPSQVMVPPWQFTDPLDFVLIDGPHAYPFPDLEYYYFYPHIRNGGVLVVDDIHIPSIRGMYEFLRDDAMWEHRGDVRTTAFFRRTDKPEFNPLSGDWVDQRFNRRRFASPEALAHLFGHEWYQTEFGVPGPAAGTPVPEGTESEIAKLKARIEALERSTSWRVTSPVRYVVDRFRRLGSRP